MERGQELEWAKAQKIVISEDLVAAAKQQLRFLAEVDRNRCLYDGPILDKAVYRYKNCWLPLLAKHTKSHVTEGPLVVPLDCEWVWHCHRLDPVRYKADCEEFYGKILDNKNVASSVQGISEKLTEEIWNRLYPGEPYELSIMNNPFAVVENTLQTSETTKYDLVSAVKRQSSFFYQVSRPYVKKDVFLEGALARYKGFLYLVNRNNEQSIKCFTVPTYDIDLIWHSHQLQPVSYCNDLVRIIGKVMGHDDKDSDRTKGKKLDVGFSGTTKQWEDTFGFRYWRAGAMNRGSLPSPLAIHFNQIQTPGGITKVVPSFDHDNIIQLSEKTLVEVMVEIVEVENLPVEHKGRVFVACSKKQSDAFFNAKTRLNVFSETDKEQKQVVAFQCEPSGEIVFELMSYDSNSPAKSLGTVSISLQDDLMNPISELWKEKWFNLVPNSGVVGSEPISLRIAISFTPPVPSPYMLRLVQLANGWTSVVDETGNRVINIQMNEARNGYLARKEVIGMTKSGETCVLAEFSGTGWSLVNSNWFFQLQKKLPENEDIFELRGSRKVIIFPGRKLEYELKNYEKQNFMTAVEFSTEKPYGKAVALLNLKSGFVEINEKWLLLPGVLLAFLLNSEGYIGSSNNASKRYSDKNKAANRITNIHGGACGGCSVNCHSSCGSSCGGGGSCGRGGGGSCGGGGGGGGSCGGGGGTCGYKAVKTGSHCSSDCASCDVDLAHTP